MNFLSDHPINSPENDELGYKGYAELLSECIMDTKELPFCLGIFGAWGVGKTSIMVMIQHHLKNNGFKTIWFNPWKYNNSEDVRNALIQSVLYEIATDSRRKVKNLAFKTAKSLAWNTAKYATNIISNGLISPDKVEAAKNILTKEDQLYYRYKNHFEDDFKKVVDLYISGSPKNTKASTTKAKLVIFIDDLDRCLPENTVKIIESLKLFVGDASCVFVLAMDPAIIQKGIKSIYMDKISFSGRDYLEKVIQVPFMIPQVSLHDLQQAIKKSELGKTLFENGENICDEQSIWWILDKGLSISNLRQYKRFFNSYCYFTRRDCCAKSHLKTDLIPSDEHPIDLESAS